MGLPASYVLGFVVGWGAVDVPTQVFNRRWFLKPGRGIIYGAHGCLAQTDMKRLIAFSSVAHMGYVMLGIATLTDFGINAAVFGMVSSWTVVPLSWPKKTSRMKRSVVSSRPLFHNT